MDEIIELLLKRMESNPEEFCEGWVGESDYIVSSRPIKWNRFVYQLRERMDCIRHDRPEGGVPLAFLNNNQIRRLYDKYTEIQGNEFEKYVLRTLLGPNTPEPLEVTVSTVTFADPGAQSCT